MVKPRRLKKTMVCVLDSVHDGLYFDSLFMNMAPCLLARRESIKAPATQNEALALCLNLGALNCRVHATGGIDTDHGTQIEV